MICHGRSWYVTYPPGRSFHSTELIVLSWLAWNETSALEWATTGALVFGSAHASLAESTTWAKGNGERWEKPMAIPWFIMFNHVQSFSHENRHKLEDPQFLDHPKFMFYRYQNPSPDVSRSNCSWTHRHGEIVAMGWQTKGTDVTSLLVDDQTMGISSFFIGNSTL